MRKKARSYTVYHALVTFPDHLYPFRCKLRGQWVRGIRSYDQALRLAFRTYGRGRYGFKLMVYRSFFHVVGALTTIFAAAFVSQKLFGNASALYVVLVLTVLFITFQEFYLQRRMYQQLWRKGILDWFAWVVPIGLYFFSFIR